MKKLFVSALAMLAVALGFTACSSEDEFVNETSAQGQKVTVIASTGDDGVATRTALEQDGDKYKVVWSEGDKISVGGNLFTLTSGAGTTNGTFEGIANLKESFYDVYYPATYRGTTATWPFNQKYVKNNIPQGVPMKAKVLVLNGQVIFGTKFGETDGGGINGSSISFYNEGGILRLNLKGTAKVASIKISATNLTNPITLNCDEPVQLTSAGVPFHIAVPGADAGTAYSGLKIEITDNTGAVCTKTLKSGKTISVKRSMITDITLDADNFVPKGFVDLGVYTTSGKHLYWKKCNLGAGNPQDPGDYYMWGATNLMYSAVNYTTGAFTIVSNNPYGDNYMNTWDASNGFCYNNMPFSKGLLEISHNKNVFTKYTTSAEYAKVGYSVDNLTALNPEDDAATAKNASWRMPTIDDFKSLVANCVLVWTSGYNSTGNAGYIVYKAKNVADKGKAYMNGTWKKWNGSGYTNGSAPTETYSVSGDDHIFLPAAGYGNTTTLLSKNRAGCYCSSDLNTSRNYSVGAVNFTNSLFNIAYNYFRSYGFSIRPVFEEK